MGKENYVTGTGGWEGDRKFKPTVFPHTKIEYLESEPYPVPKIALPASEDARKRPEDLHHLWRSHLIQQPSHVHCCTLPKGSTLLIRTSPTENKQDMRQHRQSITIIYNIYKYILTEGALSIRTRYRTFTWTVGRIACKQFKHQLILSVKQLKNPCLVIIIKVLIREASYKINESKLIFMQ